MKVTFRREPNVLGVRSGADLDTNDLPPEDAENLRRLVDEAQIATADGGLNTPMPDQRKITIRVEGQDRQLEVMFAEGQAPPGVDSLLEYLERHAKIIPDK